MHNHPKIIFEDNHLLIIEKPTGYLVQGDHTKDATLTDWGRDYIKKKYNKPGKVFLHPTHRIDRPVSGMVIFARTSKALERMNKLFQTNQILKSYLSIVKGKPKSNVGKIENWLIKDHVKNITKSYNKEISSSKRAVLTYEILEIVEGHSLLLVKPQTGRSHQIRVQLSGINCPIQGDLKYGYESPNTDKSISLHAYKLQFTHPVKKELIKVISSPNGKYWKLFKEKINALD